VGTFSYQKGIYDYARIVQRLHRQCEFRFVGSVPAEGLALALSLEGKVTFVPRVPPEGLSEQYAWGDIFLFPTIQDGFAAVLNQAAASGLPVLASRNCSAPDFVQPDQTGWILPIREPEAYCERLNWCDGHRAELAQMAEAARHSRLLSWADAAAKLLEIQKRK
jgi:glycosyltransferase involved in cell wall biosynthesis